MSPKRTVFADLSVSKHSLTIGFRGNRQCIDMPEKEAIFKMRKQWIYLDSNLSAKRRAISSAPLLSQTIHFQKLSLGAEKGVDRNKNTEMETKTVTTRDRTNNLVKWIPHWHSWEESQYRDVQLGSVETPSLKLVQLESTAWKRENNLVKSELVVTEKRKFALNTSAVYICSL